MTEHLAYSWSEVLHQIQLGIGLIEEERMRNETLIMAYSPSVDTTPKVMTARG